MPGPGWVGVVGAGQKERMEQDHNLFTDAHQDQHPVMSFFFITLVELPCYNQIHSHTHTHV
jgi:hypothetical protein